MTIDAPLPKEEYFKKIESELSHKNFQYIPTDDDNERYLEEYNKEVNQAIKAVESFSKNVETKLN